MDNKDLDLITKSAEITEMMKLKLINYIKVGHV